MQFRKAFAVVASVLAIALLLLTAFAVSSQMRLIEASVRGREQLDALRQLFAARELMVQERQLLESALTGRGMSMLTMLSRLDLQRSRADSALAALEPGMGNAAQSVGNGLQLALPAIRTELAQARRRIDGALRASPAGGAQLALGMQQLDALVDRLAQPIQGTSEAAEATDPALFESVALAGLASELHLLSSRTDLSEWSNAGGAASPDPEAAGIQRALPGLLRRQLAVRLDHLGMKPPAVQDGPAWLGLRDAGLLRAARAEGMRASQAEGGLQLLLGILAFAFGALLALVWLVMRQLRVVSPGSRPVSAASAPARPDAASPAATDQAAAEGEIAPEAPEDLPLRDALTGLVNARGFLQEATRHLAIARRHSSALAVIVLDLDQFHQINVIYGVEAGDRVLQTVAELCQRVSRSGDLAGRHGGEEFALLLANTTLEGAVVHAERLRATIEGTRIELSDDRVIRVTASLGVVQCLTTDSSVEDALLRAEVMVLEAKQLGRNRVRYSMRRNVPFTAETKSPQI